MDDATLVRRRESPRDLHGVVDRLTFRHGAVPQPLAERLAFEQLGDDVRDGALAADVVDDQKIGMVERAGGPGFRLEAPDAHRGPRAPVSRQRLDRDVAAQARIAGAIHLAHASGADQAVDFVRAEPCSRRERIAHGRISLLHSFGIAPQASW